MERWGALEPRAIFDRGEVWRPITALLLHGDAGHLTANLISGLFVFSTVLSTIGRSRGALLAVLAAGVGNLAIAALHYPGPYQSLGASTAVFAGLGLLTGRAVRRMAQAPAARRWPAVFVPLAAGATLLGLFGAGALPTDVGAHLTGFAAGLGLGYVAALRRRELRAAD
ncbi:MAG: rhomboid family intramembrane serine protease [Opitutae bacterium]|nr:rhomboid family intramembrane serine protease [Opitutae bacterium]